MRGAIILLVLLAVSGFVLSLGWPGECLCLSLRGGKHLVIRGNPRGDAIDMLLDTARRSGAEDCTIVVKRQGDRLRIDGTGLSDGQLQRLRNVLGTIQPSQFDRQAAVGSRNLGQRLGWQWLAWKLNR